MEKPEVWLRGPVDGVPPLLQPVCHALLQAQEEINEMMKDFSPDHLWTRPHGNASIAFHLQHIPGVLDRLYTYANGNVLSDGQLVYLRNEGKENPNVTSISLLNGLNEAIAGFIMNLKTVDQDTLTDIRMVGRKQLPSTVMGLLFHCAEHTMRHTGQMLVTVKTLSKNS